MNNVVLMGRLTDSVEVKSTKNSETSYANFTLAVRDGVDQDGNAKAQFIRCTAFNKVAEIIEKFTEKGSPLCIRGHLNVSTYEDEDGKTVWSTQVIVDDFDLIGARRSDENEEKSAKKSEKKPNSKKYRR